MTPDESPLFLKNPLSDLDDLIATALDKGATRLLILAGQYPVCRVDSKLSPPLNSKPIHFTQTEALAKALLKPQQMLELDDAGAIEIDYTSETIPTRINLFYGDGAHNLVIFLK